MNRAERAERNKYIAEQVRGGRSFDDIARELGVSAQTVRNAAIAQGAYVPQRRAYRDQPETQRRDEHIVQRLREGCSVADLAREVGLSQGYVRTIALRMGFEFPTPPNRLPADERRKRDAYVIGEVGAGRSYADVAREIGMSQAGVAGIVQRARRAAGELAPRMSTEQRAKRNEKILELVRQGLPYREIGDRYGVTGARIGEIVDSYGEPDIWQKHQEGKARRAAERRQAERAIVEDAARCGISSTQIAEEHGHAPRYWERVARENGLFILNANGRPMRKSRSEFEETNAAICAYLREGHTQQEASEEFGVWQTGISRIAISNGIRRRLTGDALIERNRRIVADLENGMTQREVAEKYGMSTTNVAIIYAERNVEIRRHDDLHARNRAILADIDSGMSRVEVAEHNHVSLHTVGQVVAARRRGGATAGN